MHAPAQIARSTADAARGAPRVSVVMAAYNAAPTLCDAIASVRRQTMPDWELLIIDDGSTDATLEIAEAVATRDARIKVLTQPNAGPSRARNRGIAAAQGAWLCFHDSDDWVSPDFLARLLAVAEGPHPADVVSCTFVGVDPHGEETTVYWAQDLPDPVSAMTRGPGVATISTIVRTELVRSLGGFDETLITAEDWDLWLRLARIGARFAAIPDRLAFYRKTPGSLSKKGRRLIEDALVVMDRAFARDPRLAGRAGPYPDGHPQEDRTDAQSLMVLYNVGIALASGEDPSPLIEMGPDISRWSLDAQGFAKHVLAGAAHGLACREEDVARHWSVVEPALARMGEALARRMGVSRQAAALCAHIEARALGAGAFPTPRRMDTVLALTLDLPCRLEDIKAEGCEALVLNLRCGQTWLGHAEVPVRAGAVTRTRLGAAIARSSRAWRLRPALTATGAPASPAFWAILLPRLIDPRRWRVAPEHAGAIAAHVKAHLVRETFAAVEAATMATRGAPPAAAIPPLRPAALGVRRVAAAILILRGLPQPSQEALRALLAALGAAGRTRLRLADWAAHQAAGLPPRSAPVVMTVDGQDIGPDDPIWRATAQGDWPLTVFVPTHGAGTPGAGWSFPAMQTIAGLGHEIAWRLPDDAAFGRMAPDALAAVVEEAAHRWTAALGVRPRTALAPLGLLDRTGVEVLRESGLQALLHPRAGLSWLDSDRMLQQAVRVWPFDTIDSVLRRAGAAND